MRLLTTTLVLLLIAATPAGANTLRERLYDATGGVMVVAHRGCHAAAPAHGFATNAPENSLEALRRCIDIGVDMVEADVRRTQDGVLVIMHDPSVDRTTDGRGLVATLTLAQIQALRLDGGDEAPPTLETFLRAARGRVLVNLHLKGPFTVQAAEVARRVDASDWVLFKAKAMKDMSPIADEPLYRDVAFMPMVGENAAGNAEQLGEVIIRQASGVRPIPAVETRGLRPRGFSAVREAAGTVRVRVWVNTLGMSSWKSFFGLAGDRLALRDPDTSWGRLIDQGVSIIQTDHPAQLLSYLKRRRLREGVTIATAETATGSPITHAVLDTQR
jgi:glycerophosphoryl diester phosphodiesterase